MSNQNAVSQSSLLQEMVRVKKLRFREDEKRRLTPKITQDVLQRSVNFQEFKTVYEEALNRKSNLPNETNEVHQTKSGSICKFPRSKKKTQYVETVNIELPLHYGGDRAVQLIENRIKPKKAPKVNREVGTENQQLRSSMRTKSTSNIEHAPKKSVTILDKLHPIEEANNYSNKNSLTNIDEKRIREIEKHFKARKDKSCLKAVIKPPLPIAKPVKKKTGAKIMDALSDINEKLQKMQDKYFNMPKIQYKNVNDCFTQSGNVEIIYENEKYPDAMGVFNKYDLKHVSENVLSDSKMQERIKEMNEMFPEFPKIEDTLKQIETHLDNIVRLENSDEKVDPESTNRLWTHSNNTWQNLDQSEIKDSLTEQILKKCEEDKGKKLRSIRHQIDEVEDFCDKLSEIANNESDYMDSVLNEINESEKTASSKDKRDSKKKSTVLDFIEGPDLQTSIKKSNYLTKEFNNIMDQKQQPMVKIFSENRLSFWRDKMKEAKKVSPDYSVESVTRILDTLKFTLENSLYEPAI